MYFVGIRHGSFGEQAAPRSRYGAAEKPSGCAAAVMQSSNSTCGKDHEMDHESSMTGPGLSIYSAHWHLGSLMPAPLHMLAAARCFVPLSPGLRTWLAAAGTFAQH